ncbi:MAG: nitrogen regulation protein NR(I) [Alphaproteobacteria bacterium]
MPEATILLADDDAGVRTVLSQALIREGYGVRTAEDGAGLLRLVESGEGNLVVTDVVFPHEDVFQLLPRIRERRPELPILVMSARNTILTAIAAADAGAYEYLPKPFDLRDLTTVVRRALSAPKALLAEYEHRERLPLIGRSVAMQEIYRVIARVMHTDLTVLVSGESGTGKELVARALHDYGKRRVGPFVSVNMTAVPRELVDQELFGGEVAHGRFRQAEGGTLFLDEIGDMPLEVQTRLLHVLRQGEYRGTGGCAATRADVRIVVATNRDLHQLIHHGLFREDLFYRLNVVPLRMPPLRERAEDVPDLAQHFLRKVRVQGLPRKDITPAALERLKNYDWPGNVRELENLIRRIVVLTTGQVIEEDAVIVALAEARQNGRLFAEETLSAAVERCLRSYFGDGMAPATGLYQHVVDAVERPLIALALEAARGNQIRAAQMLGLNRNTLRKKMRELGIVLARAGRPG